MTSKKWIFAAAGGIVATPVAMGVAMVLLVAVIAQDGGGGGGGTWPTASSLKIGGKDGVPPQYAQLILDAAARCDQGLPPAVLAAQIWAESAFKPDAISRDPRTGAPIAYGISQFIPDTWAVEGIDGDGDGDKDVMDPKDAIPSQGSMMCKLLRTAKAHPGYNGSPVELALAGYNAGWGRVDEFRGVPPRSFAGGQTYDYVKAIMEKTVQFTEASPGGPVDIPPEYSLPSDTPPQVRTAVSWALKQKDGWYHLGGDCTNAHGQDPDHWCDCSSLMQQAYKAAGIDIPRVTFDQINLPIRVDLNHPKAGDLVFNPGSDGSEASPGHVGMYIGGADPDQGFVLEAPRTGVRTRIVTYNSWRHSTNYMTKVSGVRRVVNW
ncbi:C40 family peptidase [Streptomyces sp. WAC07061]|uniref:C40 family peptidase n=1 Tax=Streptomyces sp. WAC07061 TaxID=2487410 RepID=UPI0021AEE2AB|nr:C40 family peptidase [Streptomyces sp. WAC07061]